MRSRARRARAAIRASAGSRPSSASAGPPLRRGPTRYRFPPGAPTRRSIGPARRGVPGGWHHGDDIFAALGTPILAAANGTVFSVGWNKIGGWRLWLRDDSGNEYYYAHLSAYSPFAVNGAIVQAGDVLGFVGESGDAEGKPVPLHLGVAPVGLLRLG